MDDQVILLFHVILTGVSLGYCVSLFDHSFNLREMTTAQSARHHGMHFNTPTEQKVLDKMFLWFSLN